MRYNLYLNSFAKKTVLIIIFIMIICGDVFGVVKHNVTWNVLGTTTIVSYNEGTSITFNDYVPKTPIGYVFKGWTTSPISGSQNDAPSFVTEANMGNQDITYYAVFAKGADVITVSDLNGSYNRGKSEISCKDFSNLEKSSGAKYSGNTGETINRGISLPYSSSSGCGIVSTSSNANITGVSISAWDNSVMPTDRKIEVYGNNTPYSSSMDLYDNKKKGTLLGTINFDHLNKSSTTSLAILGSFKYIGLLSGGGNCAFTSIAISYENSTFSDYCTSVKGSFNISSTGWSTFCTDDTFIMPENTMGVIVSTNNNNDLTLINQYHAGNIVPANTPMLIKANAGTYDYYVTAGTGTYPTTNYLRGQLVAGTIKAEENENSTPHYYYKLSIGSEEPYLGKLGFYWGADEGAPFNLTGNNRSYLVIEKSAFSAKGLLFDFDDVESCITEIENIGDIKNEYYNLQGQKISKPISGQVYICNGKKYVQL